MPQNSWAPATLQILFGNGILTRSKQKPQDGVLRFAEGNAAFEGVDAGVYCACAVVGAVLRPVWIYRFAGCPAAAIPKI